MMNAHRNDEIYTLGTGSTSIKAPRAYQEETSILKHVVNELCAGSILDIPCGTAFWLPSYAQRCTTVLLGDQSAKMLDESRQRARQAGMAARCQFRQHNIFAFAWPHQRFDVVLVGFFLSHLKIL
ncbi:MAG: class I SAM-dependent methyltransferase [Desulfobacteraceae bacterium]|jgi:ubiquinone/menaquinone biosynthesis C-methylase UbiE